jgi:general secretion pathway protein I
MNGRQRRHNPDGGFTLVEILVAFAVAVITLAALYQVFSLGLRSGARAESYSEAVLLAQSSLDTLAAGPIAVGDITERVGRYQRRVSVRARMDLVPPDGPLAVIPYEIAVQVSWRDGVRPREIALSTLRLDPP